MLNSAGLDNTHLNKPHDVRPLEASLRHGQDNAQEWHGFGIRLIDCPVQFLEAAGHSLGSFDLTLRDLIKL